MCNAYFPILFISFVFFLLICIKTRQKYRKNRRHHHYHYHRHYNVIKGMAQKKENFLFLLSIQVMKNFRHFFFISRRQSQLTELNQKTGIIEFRGKISDCCFWQCPYCQVYYYIKYIKIEVK